MTQDEINREREESRRALTDQSHPWHGGVMVFIEAYNLSTTTERARQFMRAVAPYMFDGDNLISPNR